MSERELIAELVEALEDVRRGAAMSDHMQAKIDVVLAKVSHIRNP